MLPPLCGFFFLFFMEEDLLLLLRREYQKLSTIADGKRRFQALANRIIELRGPGAPIVLSRFNGAVFGDLQLQWILANCFYGEANLLLDKFPDRDFYQQQLDFVPPADENHETHELQLLDGGGDQPEMPTTTKSEAETFATSSAGFLWWQLFRYYDYDVVKFNTQVALILRRLHKYDINQKDLLMFCFLVGRPSLLLITQYMADYYEITPDELRSWLIVIFLVNAFAPGSGSAKKIRRDTIQLCRAFWYDYLAELVPSVNRDELRMIESDVEISAKTAQIAAQLGQRMTDLLATADPATLDLLHPWNKNRGEPVGPYGPSIDIIRNHLNNLDPEVDFSIQNAPITVIRHYLTSVISRFTISKFTKYPTPEHAAIRAFFEEHLPLPRESLGKAMMSLLFRDERTYPLADAFFKEFKEIIATDATSSPTAWLELKRPTRELQVLRRNLAEQVYNLKDLPGTLTHRQLLAILLQEPLNFERWAPSIFIGILEHLSGFDNLHTILRFLVQWMSPEMERIHQRNEELERADVNAGHADDADIQKLVVDNELREWNEPLQTSVSEILMADRFVQAEPPQLAETKEKKASQDSAIRFISEQRLNDPEKLSSQLVARPDFLRLIAHSTSDALLAASKAERKKLRAAAETPEDSVFESANSHVPDYPHILLRDRYPGNDYTIDVYESAEHVHQVFHFGGHGAQTFDFPDHWRYYAYQASLSMEFYDNQTSTRHTNGHLRLITIFPDVFYRDTNGRKTRDHGEYRYKTPVNKTDHYFPIDLQLLQGLYALPYTSSSAAGTWTGLPFSSVARFRQFAVPENFKGKQLQDEVSLVLSSNTEGVVAFRPQPSIFYEAMRLLNSHEPTLNEANKVLTVIDPNSAPIEKGDDRYQFYSRLGSFTAQSLALPWDVFPFDTAKRSGRTVVGWGTRVIPVSAKYEQSRALIFTRDLIVRLPQPNGTVDESGTAPGSRAIQLGVYIQSPLHVEPVFVNEKLVNFVLFLDPWAISVNKVLKMRNDGAALLRTQAAYLDPLDQPVPLRLVQFDLQNARELRDQKFRTNFTTQHLKDLTAAEGLPTDVNPDYEPRRHRATRDARLDQPIDAAKLGDFSETIRSQPNFSSIADLLANTALPPVSDAFFMPASLAAQSYSTEIDYVQGFCFTSAHLKNLITTQTSRNMGFFDGHLSALKAEQQLPPGEPSFGQYWASIYHRWPKITLDPEIVNECISAPSAGELANYKDSIERIDSVSGTLRFYMRHRLGHGLYAFVCAAVTKNWLWLRWLKTSQFNQSYAAIGDFQVERQQEVEMFTEHHDHENRSYGDGGGGGGGGQPPPPTPPTSPPPPPEEEKLYPSLGDVKLQQEETLPPASPYYAPTETAEQIRDISVLVELRKVEDWFGNHPPTEPYPKPFVHRVLTGIYRWTIGAMLAKANSTSRLCQFAPAVPATITRDWVLRNLRPPYRLQVDEKSATWALQDAAWMYSTMADPSLSSNALSKIPSWAARSLILSDGPEIITRFMDARQALIAVRQTQKIYPRFFKAGEASVIDAATYIWNNRNQIVALDQETAAKLAQQQPPKLPEFSLGLENLIDYTIHAWQKQKPTTTGDKELSALIVALTDLGAGLVPYSDLFRVSSADQTVEAYPLNRSVINYQKTDAYRVVDDLMVAFDQVSLQLRFVCEALSSIKPDAPMFMIANKSVHGRAIFWYASTTARLFKQRLAAIDKVIAHIRGFLIEQRGYVDGESWILQGDVQDMILRLPLQASTFGIADRMQHVWDTMTKSGEYALESSLVMQWLLFLQHVFYITEFPTLGRREKYLPLVLGRAKTKRLAADDLLRMPNTFEQPLPMSLPDEATNREAPFYNLREIARSLDMLRSGISAFAVSLSLGLSAWPVMEKEIEVKLAAFPPGTPSAEFAEAAASDALAPPGVYQGDSTAGLLPPASPFNVYYDTA